MSETIEKKSYSLSELLDIRQQIKFLWIILKKYIFLYIKKPAK